MSEKGQLSAVSKVFVGLALLVIVVALPILNRMSIEAMKDQMSADIKAMHSDFMTGLHMIGEGIRDVRESIVDSPNRSFDVWLERGERLRKEREAQAAEDAKKKEGE